MSLIAFLFVIISPLAAAWSSCPYAQNSTLVMSLSIVGVDSCSIDLLGFQQAMLERLNSEAANTTDGIVELYDTTVSDANTTASDHNTTDGSVELFNTTVSDTNTKASDHKKRSRSGNLRNTPHRRLTTIFYYIVTGQCTFCLPNRRNLRSVPIALQELLDILSDDLTDLVRAFVPNGNSCPDLAVVFDMLEHGVG